MKVTKSEFDRLLAERERLQSNIKKAQEAQEEAQRRLEEAQRAQQAAYEASRTAFAKEMRLRQQLDLVDKRSDEAVAVELRGIEEQEEEEQAAEATLDFDEPSYGLSLSPTTWGALDGVDPFDWSLLDPDPGGIVAEAGGNS